MNRSLKIKAEKCDYVLNLFDPARFSSDLNGLVLNVLVNVPVLNSASLPCSTFQRKLKLLKLIL